MPSVRVFRKNPTWVDSLLGNVARIQGKEIACGFPKGMSQAYPDGEQVASVAARNCWGIGVAQRDFMSYAVPDIMERTKALMKRIIKLNNLQGDHSQEIRQLQEQAGQVAANCIKMAIRSGMWEPNSDRPMSFQLRAELEKNWGVKIPEGMGYLSAKRKFHHSDKPLVDTGHLIQSATYVVRDR